MMFLFFVICYCLLILAIYEVGPLGVGIESRMLAIDTMS